MTDLKTSHIDRTLDEIFYFGYIETKSKPDFVLQIHRNVLVNDWQQLKHKYQIKKGENSKCAVE